MRELAKAIRAVLERVGDFFDIFDLSFFVSGAVALAALRVYDPELAPSTSLDAWTAITAGVGCYVLGLLSFAVGRNARRTVARLGARRRRARLAAPTEAALTPAAVEDPLESLVRAHHIDDDPRFARYLPERGAAGRPTRIDGDRLYARLWADVRQDPALAPSFALIRRYWVLAATYDGVAAALVLWSVALLCRAEGWGTRGASWSPAIAALPLVAAVCCSFEAARMVRAQRDELCATVAVGRDRAAAAAAARPRSDEEAA